MHVCVPATKPNHALPLAPPPPLQAKFNFQLSGYLEDEPLREKVAACSTFPQLKQVIKGELLRPPPFPAELRAAAAGARSDRVSPLPRPACQSVGKPACEGCEG